MDLEFFKRLSMSLFDLTTPPINLTFLSIVFSSFCIYVTIRVDINLVILYQLNESRSKVLFSFF